MASGAEQLAEAATEQVCRLQVREVGYPRDHHQLAGHDGGVEILGLGGRCELILPARRRRRASAPQWC